MPLEKVKNKRLLGLFLAGVALFNYPLLSLFNVEMIVLGVPFLYLYLYAVWILLILLVVAATKFRLTPPPEETPEKEG